MARAATRDQAPRVRILVWHGAGGAPAELTALYRRISQALAGAPGLLGNELLRSTADPDSFVIMSEWHSLEAFHAWAATPDHLVTAPLRRYRVPGGRGRPYEMYEVLDAYAYADPDD
jgi:heme-degrading monooxygenase HmoA